MLRNIISLVLYKTLFILFRLIIIIQRFQPLIKPGIELIFICISLIIEDFIVAPILKPQEGETIIILVFFIILIEPVPYLDHIVVRAVHDHHSGIRRRETVHRSLGRILSIFNTFIKPYKRCHGIDQTACLRFSARFKHFCRAVKAGAFNDSLNLRVIIQDAAHTVPAPAMPKQNNRKIRNFLIFFHKRDRMIQIDHALRNTTHAGTFTLVAPRGIIGKNIITILCKIISQIHIRVVPRAKTMGNNHYSMLLLPRTVQIAGKLLSLIGREGVLRALQPVKILHAKHKRLIAVTADIKVFVVYIYTKDPPPNNQQKDDPSKDGENDFLL